MKIDAFENQALILGGVFLLLALLMLWFPPKKINSWYGYRTISSMRNQQRWNFAQQFSTYRTFEIAAFWFLLFAVFDRYKIYNEKYNALVVVLLILNVVYLVWRTESALHSQFPNT